MLRAVEHGMRTAYAGVALIVVVSIVSASCRSVLSRKYEYDEDMHLALDGSATLYVNASIPALVALRGVDLDVDPRARLDLQKVRAMYESAATHVASATGSRRDYRRYVHLRIEVSDVQRLADVAPLAWSTYAIERSNEVVKYRQTVGPAVGREVGNVGWTGNERVAFRLHLPSRIPFHNSPSREIERGNIIVWEQPLTERIKGQPIDIQVHMEPQSILIQTLTLFGITVLLAAATFALAIWWVMRRRPGSAISDQRSAISDQ